MNYSILNSDTDSEFQFMLFKQGNQEGFGYIYNNMFPSSYWYAMRILNDDFVSNTIIQEAFLKVWKLRARMTSLLHVLRFIRLIIRWESAAYFRKKVSKYLPQFTYLEYAENTIMVSYNMEQEVENHLYLEQQSDLIKQIHDAIPYLPANQQTIMQLYLDYGCDLKDIAKRFGSNHQGINLQIGKTIDFLRKMLNQSKIVLPDRKRQPIPNESWVKYLKPDEAQIYELRKCFKYDFQRISKDLNIPVNTVLQKYINADQTLKKNKSNERFNSYSNKKNSVSHQ